MKVLLFVTVIMLALGTMATVGCAQIVPGRFATGTTVSVTKYFGEFNNFPQLQDKEFWMYADAFVRYHVYGGLISQEVWRHSLSVSLHVGTGQLRYALPVHPLTDPVITDTFPHSREPSERLFPGRKEGSTNRIDILPMYAAFSIHFFPHAKVVPNIFVGGGVLYFYPKDDTGNPLPRNDEHRYTTTTWIVPFGLGVEVYLAPDLAVSAGVKYFLTGTDYLDDVKNFGDGSGTSNDAFFTFGAGLSYFFGKHE